MTPIRARQILVAALGLGLLGDLVARGPFWPTGFAVCVVASALVFLVVGSTRPFAILGDEGGFDRLILATLMILAATGLTLRSAGVVQLFDTLTVLASAALLVWRMGGRGLAEFRPADLLVGGVQAGIATLVGVPALIFGDAEWRSSAPTDGRRTRAFIVGSLLALPPVIIIAALLGEADPAFGKFIQALTGPDFEEVIGHALTTAFIAWPVAGWLRGASRSSSGGLAGLVDDLPKFDFFGVAPALYAIVVLLGAYLAFQARALFGGAAYVEATMGLTYADYARRGFFELVAVTAIVLAVLLVGDWAIDQEEERAVRRFRSTGWVVVTLVGVLMGSALQRMWVYVTFFGLSDTRLYATMGMTWLGAALGWFGWTVLRGKRSRYGAGMLVATAAWVAVLNLMNPEGVVVRVNLARALEGRAFDVIYHGHLSADATPALLEAAPRLAAGDCRGLIQLVYLDHEGRNTHPGDWRTWNAAEARADRELVGPQMEQLDRRCPAGAPTTPADRTATEPPVQQ